MKYIIFIIFTILSVSSYADDNSGKLLSNLSSKLDSFKSYNAKFNVLVDGENIGVGEYSVSGDKFHIEILDKEMFSDGKVQYDINNEDQEITIDNIDSEGGDILSNPATAFSKLSAFYTHTYFNKVDILGEKYDLIKLKAKDVSSAIMFVDLYLNTLSGLPYKIVYKVNDSENVIEVILDEIVKTDRSVGSLKYKFNKDNYKDYELIDFR